MILSENSVAHFALHPDWARMADEYPLHWFGWHIRYPKQDMIIRQWLEVQPKVCIISGWKRTGKTQVGAFIGSSWLLGEVNHKAPGPRAMGITKDYHWKKRRAGERIGLIGGKSMDHVESVLLEEYRQLIPRGFVKDWFSRTRHGVTTYQHGRFVVRTYDQHIDNWKSGAYQFVHLDEEPTLEVLNEVLERTRTTEGKIMITVALDDADVSYLPEACEKPLKYFGTKDILHFKLGVEDVPKEIYPEASKVMVFQQYDDTPLRDAVRKGEFAHVGGKWLPEFRADLHVIPAFKIPAHWLKWRFMDAGVAAPTGCLWVALSPAGFMVAYREYYKTGTTIDGRCQDVIELSGNRRQRDGQMWTEIESNEKYMSTYLDYHEFKTDAATGDGVDYHYVAAGLSVQPSTTLGQEARREVARRWLLVDPKQDHFITHKPGAPRVYVFDTCPNLIWEIQRKCLKKTANERASVSEKRVQNRDDHLIDCFEYACCELEFWKKEASEATSDKDD